MACDPIDIRWGLRLAKNGKDKGVSVVVFGLVHADIPLTQDMGREIAHAIVQENVSCGISIFGMLKVLNATCSPSWPRRYSIVTLCPFPSLLHLLVELPPIKQRRRGGPGSTSLLRLTPVDLPGLEFNNHTIILTGAV